MDVLPRNVSAEIFVVCREFLAPKFIDPKFLDPKHVFKDLSASIPDGSDKLARAHNAEANVFQPEKKRRKRDGYEDGNYTLFKSIPVSELIHSTDPISVLGSANKITFQTDEEKELVRFVAVHFPYNLMNLRLKMAQIRNHFRRRQGKLRRS